MTFMDEYKPFDMIHKSLNKTVVIALKDGRFLKGRLIGYDTELNLSMDNAEIFNDEMKKKLGVVVIRKNNVISFTPGDTL
ncbi:MAG TPA: small nuclear ribonucleoprotein [Thermoplasmata archaeon]|nr:small nuclear ribonucleoprotein [Thermoplasmata archaeon]